MRTRQLSFLLVLLVAAGCSARRPVFYPNERLTQAGPDGSQRDIDECMQLAEQYVDADPELRAAGKVGKDVLIGGGTGAAAGAVGGAIWGGAGRGAAAGAAAGATVAVLHNLLSLGHSDDPLRRRYVEACLTERGYRVLGWE
jgi:hypothetical protein